jgi:hypothetical protein
MKILYLTGALLLVLNLTWAQKQTLPFSNFTGVDVFGPFDVELIKSDTESVEIDYRGISQQDVITEINHGVVKLKLKNRHFFDDWNENQYHKSKYMIVKIRYKELDRIEAQAGAVISSKQYLKSKYLTLETSMGAEVDLEIYSKKLEVNATMGAVTELRGQVEYLDVKANMGGVLKASQLESKIVYAKAGMGAEVLVNATEEIEASSSFGASIEYVGGPNVRHSSKSMGGEVHHRGH